MEIRTNTSNASSMTETIQSLVRAGHKSHLGRRVLRIFARVVGVGFALIVGLALLGAGYEAIAAGGDAKAYPPPGKLVDVGGYRLHIQCVGTADAGKGNPTVVLDAGLSRTSLDWNLVQPEIAKTTR